MSDASYPRFGPYLKNLRLERRITLRDFAKLTRQDVGYLSRVERGVLTPPQSEEAIDNISDALGVKHGSAEWCLLTDYAAVDNANVPDDLMRRKPVADILPFCFARFREMNESQFNQFVKKLQES